VLVAFAFALAACSDDTTPATADARVEGLPVDAGPVNFSLPPGGAGSAAVSAALGKGQVRAGRVTEMGQLVSGIKVQGRVGDYKLYNDRVAFVIASERATDGWGPYGGELLDGVRLGLPDGEGQSLLGETLFGLGVRMVKPGSVGVVSDGSDGKPALVRVIGDPAPFPLLAAILGELGGEQPVKLVIDYVLPPDSDVLEVRWRLFNLKRAALEVPLLIVGVTSGDGADFFSEATGFAVETPPAQDHLAMIGRSIAYALYSPEALLSSLTRYEGIWVLSQDGFSIPAAGEAQRVFRLLVAAGEPEAVRRGLRALRGKPDPARLSGKVSDPDGAAVAGARVNVQRADQSYVTMTGSDASGAFEVRLEAGKYLLTPIADGRAPVAATAVEVATAAVTKDLQVSATAGITYTVTDDKDVPLPAKLIIEPKAPPAAWPASFGEPSLPGSALRLFAPTGAGSAALPPGEYTVTASRGYEYELHQVKVTLAAGETKPLVLKLTRSVDTTGYMCGDFHVHAMWSPDSSDLYELKVAALAGEGVEIPVITEHEVIADLNPTIVKLGLQPWVRGVIGEELTTSLYGHFNPFPLTPLPGKPNGGAVVWYGHSPPEVFAEVHKTWPDAVLQVNHPRGSPNSAYFSYVGYDPKTAAVKLTSQWTRAFEAVEVFNGAGWSAYQDSTVADWYSFLDRGFLVTATGNSDSHDAVRYEVGYPRNYVKLSSDEPAKLDLSELAKSVREQRVVVSGGAFLSVSVGGKSLGEVADATAKKATAAIKVQAPTWVALDKLRVIVGGEVAYQVTLDASTADPTNPVVRFNKDIELLLDKDSWMIVVATGSGTLDPVTRGAQPFAVTNPIYLDVDGNGVYDPPKSF